MVHDGRWSTNDLVVAPDEWTFKRVQERSMAFEAAKSFEENGRGDLILRKKVLRRLTNNVKCFQFCLIV